MTKSWFPAVRGHERAKVVLAHALERGSVPPALILAGHPGTGRALLARELAKALLCRGAATVLLPHAAGDRGGAAGDSSGGSSVPCGACLPCRKVESGAHNDVIRVSPDEGKVSLGIDRVREVLEELSMAPVEGRRRVLILDPADAMTEDAQNALLKALEEPPARAHIFLVAQHEEALLRTIASRAFVLALRELSADDVRAVLEARGLPAADARERAAWAGGRPGVALGTDLIERVATARALVEALASGQARKDPLGVAQDLVNRAAPKTKDPQERRDGALETLDLVARTVRDALDRATRGEAAARLSGADAGLLARLAAAGADALVGAGLACQKAEDAIVANQNVNLSLEGLVLDVVVALDSARARDASRAPAAR